MERNFDDYYSYCNFTSVPMHKWQSRTSWGGRFIVKRMSFFENMTENSSANSRNKVSVSVLSLVFLALNK